MVMCMEPWLLKIIPDRFKTQQMCDKAVARSPYTLRFVPGWSVTQQQVKIWHDDSYYCDDDKLIKWYEDYKKRKGQKAQIKEELLPIA